MKQLWFARAGRSGEAPPDNAQSHRHAPAARGSAPRARHARQAGGQRRRAARLRFDFTHYAACDREQLKEIERLINEAILANIEMRTDVMSIDDALSTGAMALFGEKYGDKVRVVSVRGLQPRTVRRHARAPHRRYRRLQDRLRRQHLGRRAPHRSDHRGSAVVRSGLKKTRLKHRAEQIEKLNAADRSRWRSRSISSSPSSRSAQVARSGRIGAHSERREGAGGARRWHGPLAVARPGRFASQQMEDRRRRAGSATIPTSRSSPP